MLTLALAVLINALAATPVYSAEKIGDNPSPAMVEPDPERLRILGLRVNTYSLEDLVTGYAIENSTYLPLGAIAEFTDMAIKVEPQNAIASGFIFREDRRFFLDMGRGEVTIAGRKYPVDRQKIRIYPDDIYIEANTLSAWMPFTVDVDLFSSLITITSEEKLPLEERIERDKRFRQAAGRAPSGDKGYPGVFEPYRQWTAPKFTATVRNSVTQSAGQTNNSSNYSIHATNDLFYLESSMYLSGDSLEPLRDARLTLGRKDPENGLLGRVNASEFAFGHIDIGQSPHVTRSSTPQPGAFVSTYPLDKASEYDRHSFIGELPAGWEVELYHNSALLGLARSNSTGQYRFEDIPLYFGKNYFRLVFYGPQGQKREETKNFDLSDLAAKPGQQFYSVQTTQDIDGGYQSNVSLDRGVGKNLSLHLGHDTLTLGSDFLMGQPAEKRQYTNLGIKTLLGGLFVSGDYVKEANNGQLSALGLQTRIGNHTAFGAKYAQLDNFTSERYPLLPDPTQSVAEASIHTAVPKGFLPRIPMSLRLVQEKLASGARRNTVENRLSASVFRMAASNTISHVETGGQPGQTSGAFQLSRSTRKFSIRGDLNYLLQPSSDLSSAAITIDSIRAGSFILGFGLSHSPVTSTQSYTARMTRARGKFAINADASVSSTGTITAGLGITVGVGREPRTPYWTSTARPLAGMGAASIRVFLDNNDDGVFNDGDEPLEGVRIKIQGNPSIEKSGKDGIILVTNLPPHRYLDLEPAVESLEDPLWVASVKGVKLIPRPGAISRIDFPIIKTGEIDGTVYLYANNRLQGAGDVKIELINNSGKLVKTLVTAPDGFYVIGEVPVGEYLVRVSPGQIRELGLFDVRPIQVRLDSRHQFISGINFRLEKR